jgi:myo-inositol catabolism protein IolS
VLFTDSKLFSQPISRITFGGAALSGEGGGYGFGEISENESESLLKASWDAGINIYDTAPIYGFGLSEERLGRYLNPEAIVVSKGGVDWHPNRRVNMSNDPAVLEKMFYESLKRLKREKIDIYMLHWPDPRVDTRKAMEVLASLQRKGLITHLGLSNTNQSELQKAQQIAPIMAIQNECNYFQHSTFDFLPKDLLRMAWGTFDKGILSGRANSLRKYHSSDARSWAPWWKKSNLKEKFESVEILKVILNEFNVSLTQFALSFNLQLHEISTTLVGLKKSPDLETLTQDLNQLIIRERMIEILKRLNHSHEE